MKTIVLRGVSPQQLLSPEPLERLFAEKTLSYNAGILHALQASFSSETVRRAPGNPKHTSPRRISGLGKPSTKI